MKTIIEGGKPWETGALSAVWTRQRGFVGFRLLFSMKNSHVYAGGGRCGD